MTGRILICLLSIIGLTSCSYQTVNAEGVRYYVGVVAIKEHPTPCVLVKTVDTIGLTLDTSEQTGGFNLGYRSITTSAIRKNEQLTIVEDEDNNHIATAYEVPMAKCQPIPEPMPPLEPGFKVL